MNEAYQVGPVETGVQIPQATGGCTPKYPWRQLKVGDSFKVRCPGVEKDRLWSTLTSAARHCERRYHLKFTMRVVNGGIRIWRIA